MGKASSEKGLSAKQRAQFRSQLALWYKQHARELPWRGISDPYRTWVSEIMLQQTRVAAVIERYEAFTKRFPTLVSLALGTEEEVLALWSGLGYYRRARMMHKAAQFIVREHGVVLPSNSTELRTLPGIGEYTSAAIASIAFGESIAVVDGNVERVLLRVTGHPKDNSSATVAMVHRVAQSLVPVRKFNAKENAAGDHNQAMMELGATLCLPRQPLCLECPVYKLCATKGEHVTPPRQPMRSRTAAFLLSTRKRGVSTEVLLQKRPDETSLMAGMYELPPLPLDAVMKHEPALRLRHAITNTNYYVQIYAGGDDLRRAVPAAKADLQWHRVARLNDLPLTGLTRKTLQRMDVMPKPLPDRG